MDFLDKFDKQKMQRITLTVIAALTLLALVLLIVIIISSVEANSGTGGIFGNTDKLEFETITVTENQLVTGSLVIANEDHPYSVDKSALDLIGCQFYRNEHRTTENGPYYAYNEHFLNTEAMAAVHNMLTDAESAVGLDDLMIQHAYGKHDGTNEEYNTAQLIHLSIYNGEKLVEDYSNWLNTNAVKYGFITRFENGYRYVGTVHAKYMVDKDLGLEEYVEYLKANTSHTSPLSIKVSGGSVYYVYYVAAAAGDTINVPVRTENSDGSMKYDYTISGTNEGGVVVTVKVK